MLCCCPQVSTALRIILRACHLHAPILGPKDLCTLLAVSTACNTAVKALPRNRCWPCPEVRTSMGADAETHTYTVVHVPHVLYSAAEFE